MAAQVEIGAGMYSFHFLEPKRHFKFDISSCIGIMGQFIVVVEMVFLVSQSKGFVPLKAEFLPMFEPFHFFSRTHEELHFHLFKFTHAEDKLTGNNLIAECFTNLANTKRDLHPASLLNVQEVYEYTLCRFRTQVDFHSTISRGTNFC